MNCDCWKMEFKPITIHDRLNGLEKKKIFNSSFFFLRIWLLVWVTDFFLYRAPFKMLYGNCKRHWKWKLGSGGINAFFFVLWFEFKSIVFRNRERIENEEGKKRWTRSYHVEYRTFFWWTYGSVASFYDVFLCLYFHMVMESM